MAPIKRIDAKAQGQIATVAQAALQESLAALGLTVKITKNVRSHDGEFANLTVAVTVQSEDGTPTGAEANAYRHYADMDGLDPQWLGKPFPHPTMGELAIVGFRPRSRKAPVIVKASKDGKQYVFAVDAIKRLAVRAGWTLPDHWSNKPEQITLSQRGLV